MKSCTDCKYAVKIAEHEYECTADQYDIDEKTCFTPKDDATLDGEHGGKCKTCSPDYCEI